MMKNIIIITIALLSALNSLKCQETQLPKSELEVKTLIGYPIGIGTNAYFVSSEKYRAGVQTQYGISFFEGMVNQFDLAMIMEKRLSSKRLWFFSTSLGWQYWSGSDGVWHGIRVECSWNKSFKKNNRFSYGFSIVPLIFVYPKFAPEGNLYFQFKYSLIKNKNGAKQ